MENLVFTQLSVPEVRAMFRQELETYFANNNPAQPESDQLLSVQEASEFLRLTTATIYSLVSRFSESNIPFSKRGKRLYFSKEDLILWVKSGRKQSMAKLAAETYDQLKKGRRK